MNKTQEKKKKEREKRVKAKKLARREELRKQAKQERQAKLLEKRFREKSEPIINDPEIQERRKKMREEDAKAQIQRNLEILKALEKEHAQEEQQRADINEALEDEGHFTMKDKMKALEEKTIEKERKKKKKGVKFGGSAETNFVPK